MPRYRGSVFRLLSTRLRDRGPVGTDTDPHCFRKGPTVSFCGVTPSTRRGIVKPVFEQKNYMLVRVASLSRDLPNGVPQRKYLAVGFSWPLVLVADDVPVRPPLVHALDDVFLRGEGGQPTHRTTDRKGKE